MLICLTEGGSLFWVDAKDENNADQFSWGDGTPLPDNDPLWTHGQPHHVYQGGQQDCVSAVYDYFGETGLLDEGCDVPYPFFCQVDI